MVGELRTRSRGPDDNWIHLGSNQLAQNFWTKAPFHEICTDQLHDWPLKRRNYLNDVGGPFALTKARYHRGITPSVALTGIIGRTYNGSFTDNYFGHPAVPSHLSFLTGNQMAAYGAKGWNRFKPGRPLVDVGQFIGELRQLPSLPLSIGKHLRTALTGKARTKSYMNMGSEYLNIQFGWVPFVSDIIGMLKFQEQVGARLSQLRRDNGKPVRRRGTVSTEESQTSSTTSGYLYPTLTSDFYSTFPPGTRTVITRTSTKVTFAGAFRYWIPDIDSPESQERLVRRLLGLRLTPGLLWELTPWSWLIDWFSSIGDVLDNVSGNAATNLTAPYAYVMATRTNETSVTESAKFKQVGTLTVTSHLKRQTKQRQAASPFGFGLTSTDLSVKQKLILGALGISRSGF